MRGVPCGFVIPADALIFMFGGLLSGGFVIFLHIFGIFWDHGMFNITWLYLVGGLEPWNLIFIYIYIIFPYLGNVSQLTFTPSFFRGVGQPPTSYDDFSPHVGAIGPDLSAPRQRALEAPVASIVRCFLR